MSARVLRVAAWFKPGSAGHAWDLGKTHLIVDDVRTLCGVDVARRDLVSSDDGPEDVMCLRCRSSYALIVVQAVARAEERSS